MRYQKPVILSILIVFVLKSVKAQDPIDESICKVYRRITVTKNVTLGESYENDDDLILGTRINCHLQNVTKWEPMEICCMGYEPQGKAENATTCVPVCRSDCPHGRCLRPNECACERGYRNVISNTTKYSECVPVCSSGCPGGTCTGPDTCECPARYALAKDKRSCEPICALSGSHVCAENASCISPGVCLCNDGYIMKAILNWNRTAENSWRMGPVKWPHFHRGSAICMPLCNPKCPDNSSCAAPNKCECKAGYERASMTEEGKNGFSCVPTCKRPCFNGRCAAPDKCVCLEGYKAHETLNEDFCEPICDEECVNGKCTRPGKCECFDGYEKLILGDEAHETSESVCTPVCPGQCPNGTCVSPGQCRCNAGYVLDVLRANETGTDIADTTVSSVSPVDQSSQEICRPRCEPHCRTGSTCVAPNRCRSEAHQGNQNRVVFATIDMQIVNSAEDCGEDGVLYERNGACGCEYRVDGRKCIESGLCAIIFTDEENIVNLQSISLHDSDFNGPTWTEKFDWMFRRCPVKCRTLILSKKNVDVVGKKTEHCYLLERLGVYDGLVDAALRPSSSGHERENETVICLSAGETMCGTVESKMDNGQVGQVVGIVVGMIVLIPLVAGLVAAIYLARHKIRKIRVFGATSRSNDNVMEQSEMESSSHTPDPPHV